MSDRKAEAIEQVMTHAQGLRIPLRELVKEIKTVTVDNPVGFDFTCEKGRTRDLLLAIIDSAEFGYDAPFTLFGFVQVSRLCAEVQISQEAAPEAVNMRCIWDN